jgi:cytochrome c-type biogenesis protein CcmH
VNRLPGPVDRRGFLLHAGRGALAVGAIVVADRLHAQQPAAGSQPEASTVDMSGDAYRSVRLPPKPGAKAVLDKAGIESLERQLACPCPCTLDIYVCRTTMFSCGISPRVHADVIALVEGGYSADEIMKAMTDTYGDFILGAPRKRGFNLLAWFAPFAALGAGAIGIGAMLRGWRRNARTADANRDALRSRPCRRRATPTSTQPHEELARLEAAVRGEDGR